MPIPDVDAYRTSDLIFVLDKLNLFNHKKLRQMGRTKLYKAACAVLESPAYQRKAMELLAARPRPQSRPERRT